MCPIYPGWTGADSEQILTISIYRDSKNSPAVPFGKRATMFSGRAPLGDIFRQEVSGQHAEKTGLHIDGNEKGLITEKELESGTAVTTGRHGNMLVMGKAPRPYYLPDS